MKPSHNFFCASNDGGMITCPRHLGGRLLIRYLFGAAVAIEFDRIVDVGMFWIPALVVITVYVVIAIDNRWKIA